MLALLLAFGLFLFLTLVGKALLEVVHYRESILRSWLLAPCVGLAVVVLLVLNLNQAGLPVKSFASWLTLGLALFTAAVFWRRRPIIPWRQLGLFLGISFFSLLYSCWPMFLYGFRWVGYMNGDMGTYSLAAIRTINYGFYRIPTLSELTGTDYSQYWWFHHAVGLFRAGADIFLAWCASLMHMQPLAVSMPVLGALNLSQLFGSASLVLTKPSQRRLTVLATCFLAISPFFVLGVVTQVLGQVGGIVLLLGLCTLSARKLDFTQKKANLIAHGVVLAVVFTALCAYYPEVLPFAAVAICGYHGYQLLRNRERPWRLLGFGVGAAFLVFVLARQAFFSAVGTILFAFQATKVSIVATQPFDTMLDPRVFPAVFGLHPYYGNPVDPWISVAVAVGMALLLLTVVVGIRFSLKAAPFSFLLLVMLAVGVQLLLSRSSFSLFKLGMFIQPVLFVPLAVSSIYLLRRKAWLVPIAYLAATIATAGLYTVMSTDLVKNNSVELPRLSESRIHGLHGQTREAVLADTPNMPGDYVFALANMGTDTRWSDIDIFQGFSKMATLPQAVLPLPSQLGLMPDYLSRARLLQKMIAARHGNATVLGHNISIDTGSRMGVRYLAHLAWDPWHSSNNHGGSPDNNYFAFEKMADVENYLIPVTSDQGGPQHLLGDSTISRWPAEADFYRPSGQFYAVGRRLLFEVIHPTPNMRVRISLTRSLMGEGRTRLPGRLVLEGKDKQTLPLTGSGSANIVSNAIQPFEENNRFYFALDFGMDGERFPNHKTGLMRLFNTEVPSDPRKPIGFARDIAILKESEDLSTRRPRVIKSWPTDLLNAPGLEYSGIYEDGWISDNAFVILGNGTAGDILTITGSVPRLPKFRVLGNDLEVRLNGQRIYSGTLKVGPFKIQHRFVKASRENRVELLFGRMGSLPSGDDRPVAAQIDGIAISGTLNGGR